MKRMTLKNIIILIMGWMFYSSYANAGCQWANSSQPDGPIYNVISIGATITAGRDLPNGSILYINVSNTNTIPNLLCVPGNYNLVLHATDGTPGSVNGKYPSVYPTSIPGIGVAVWQGKNIGPDIYGDISQASFSTELPNYINVPGTDSQPVNFSLANSDLAQGINIAFIKTGDIAAGSWSITSGSINSLSFNSYIGGTLNSVGGSGDVNAFNYRTSIVNGTLNIISGTCNIADNSYYFDLGVHYSDEFVGNNPVGGKSNLVTLKDCPGFNGRISTESTLAPSNITIQFNSGNVFDSANGIVNIDNTSDAASGVGVQLSLARANASDTDYDPVTFDNDISLNNYLNLTPLTADNGTYQFNIKAAYVKTTGSIKAGKANSHITFIIKYN